MLFISPKYEDYVFPFVTVSVVTIIWDNTQKPKMSLPKLHYMFQ